MAELAADEPELMMLDFDAEPELGQQTAAMEAKLEQDSGGSAEASALGVSTADLAAGSNTAVGWVWIPSKKFVMPDPDMEARVAARQRALEMLESKPPKFCSKLTCMMPKQGKQSWCSAHRKTYQNGRNDAARQDKLDAYDKLGIRNDPEMDEFMDKYILDVGLPGQRCGQKAGDFDWHSFVSEKFSTTSLTDSSRHMKMDHVAWVKYQTVDRLKSRQQAESEWADAINDTMKYPGRDFEGPGECAETLQCKRPECAGGRLRLHVNHEDIVSSDVAKGRHHISKMGTRQCKKFTGEKVAEVDELLEYGHEQFSSADYNQFSKAVVKRANPFARTAPVPRVEEDDTEEARRNKKPKGSSSSSAVAESPNKAAILAQQRGLPITESIEDAHTKAETDVRRGLLVLRANIEAAAQALAKTPEATHTSRLRAGLQMRLDAAQFWHRDAEFIKEWSQQIQEPGNMVDANGVLTKTGEEQFTKDASMSMAALENTLVGPDLEGMYSRAELEDRASDFASGSKAHDVLENRKADFGKQIDMMKEFGRLLQKAATRLTRAHNSEMKHQELLELKKKAEEDKRRAAEASAADKASKKQKTGAAALAEHTESVAAQAALAQETSAAKDIWKIDFDSCGHPHVPVLPLKFDIAEVDWNMPFIVKDVVSGADGSHPAAAEVENFLFGEEFGKYKSLLSAFRAGFQKAAKKSKDGRLGYGLPNSEAFAARALDTFGLADAVLEAPDVSGGPHAKAHEDLAKTLQPHIYGYNHNMKFTGCDPRQLSCLKFQIQGDRAIACVAFHKLHLYME